MDVDFSNAQSVTHHYGIYGLRTLVADDGNYAVFGPTGEDDPCRYLLYRKLRARPTVIRRAHFCMLNPSKATHELPDATITRCMRFALEWDFDELLVTNIFALRATDPKRLYVAAREDAVHLIGPFNNKVLLDAARASVFTVCAWGKHGDLVGRSDSVRAALRVIGAPTRVLRLGKTGQPCHPLYLPACSQPVEWR